MARTKKKKEVLIKKPKAKKKNSISITTLLLLSSLFAILLIGSIAGLYAGYVVYKNKLIDTWAILFLQLESQSRNVIERLNNLYSPIKSNKYRPIPDIVLKIENDKFIKISGDFPDTISVNDFERLSTKDKWNFILFSGVEYASIRVPYTEVNRLMNYQVGEGNYLLMWKIDISEWLFSKNAHGSMIYIITKQGNLFFSNNKSIYQSNFIKRPLVQKFVSVPMNQGQFEISSEGGNFYGFFYEISTTNGVIFVETPKNVVLSSVKNILLNFFIVLLLLLGSVGVILQIPLSTLLAPMKELVRLATEIGEGNFNVEARREGFGELNLLSESFTEMAKNLRARDEKINLLLVEQEQKLRLVNELSIAHNIQNKFLFRGKLPFDSGVEIAAQYIPAEEVAGDWYGCFYNEFSGETVFAIADVSGHGAGSAMFTSIIAAAFEEARLEVENKKKSFNAQKFLGNLNTLIVRLGHEEIHVTLLLAIYSKNDNAISFFNAGHTFPLVISDNKTSPEFLMLRSDPLGLSNDFSPAVKSMHFSSGMGVLLFTDGLIEGSPDNRLYKDKRLITMVRSVQSESAFKIIDVVYEDWIEFLNGKTAKDDLCLLALKKVA